VASVLARAKVLGGEVLTAAQAASLATALSSPDQKLIATSGGGRTGATPAGPQSEPQSVTPGAGGSVTVRFSEGQLHIGPLGELSAGPAGPPPPPKPSTAAFLVVMAASVASFALAVVLLIGAVLLLRGLPSGRRLLFTWAWLRIPVAATTAVAFWWMASTFYDAVADYTGTSGMRPAAAPRTLILEPWHPVAAGLLAQVYPLALLIALRSRMVREYFNPTE
jgi:hypothetical protein